MTRDDFIRLRKGQRVRSKSLRLVGTICEVLVPAKGERIFGLGEITSNEAIGDNGGRGGRGLIYVSASDIELIA